MLQISSRNLPEQNALQTVGQNLCLQATEHKTRYTRFGNDIPHNLHVAQLCRIRLLIHFDDTDGVGASVRHSRGAKSEQSTTTKFRQLSVLVRNSLGQKVVRKEPTKEGWARVSKAVQRQIRE